jgi:hypothetical protein
MAKTHIFQGHERGNPREPKGFYGKDGRWRENPDDVRRKKAPTSSRKVKDTARRPQLLAPNVVWAINTAPTSKVKDTGGGRELPTHRIGLVKDIIHIKKVKRGAPC